MSTSRRRYWRRRARAALTDGSRMRSPQLARTVLARPAPSTDGPQHGAALGRGRGGGCEVFRGKNATGTTRMSGHDVRLRSRLRMPYRSVCGVWSVEGAGTGKSRSQASKVVRFLCKNDQIWSLWRPPILFVGTERGRENAVGLRVRIVVSIVRKRGIEFIIRCCYLYYGANPKVQVRAPSEHQ